MPFEHSILLTRQSHPNKICQENRAGEIRPYGTFQVRKKYLIEKSKVSETFPVTWQKLVFGRLYKQGYKFRLRKNFHPRGS